MRGAVAEVLAGLKAELAGTVKLIFQPAEEGVRGAKAMVRGLRAVTDFDYEARMAFANGRLAPDLDTVFLMTDEKHALVSSSIVRDVHRWGGDAGLFVPPPVVRALAAKQEKA